MPETNYHDLAHQIIKKKDKNGIEIEAYYSIHFKLDISIEESAIKSEREELTRGFCVRVAKRNQLGQSYTNSTEISRLLATCDDALQIAEKSPIDKNWSGFPSTQSIKSVNDIYDNYFLEYTIEEVFDIIDTALEPVFAIEKINNSRISTRGQLSIDREFEGILNSNGVDCQEKRTKITLFFYGNCRKGEEVSGGVYDAISSRRFKWTSEELESFSKSFGEKLVANLGSKKVPYLKGTVILHPDVVSYLCTQSLIPALSAEQIHAKRSPFEDRIGDRIFKSQIDVLDDGILSGGINSGSFDSEGVPRYKKTTLIDQGQLKSYLYDHYYSNIFDAPNTANSKRQSYNSIPKINFTNFFIIGHGKKLLNDIINETKEGALIRGFSGNINLENGEFSGVCKNSFLIENGELKFPLRDTTIAGNFYDYLSIGSFSKDRKLTYYGIETPSLFIEY